MYRCNDCGLEYKEKVDYCDCGNNTFEYIKDVVPKKVTKPLSLEQKSEIISRLFLAVCILLSIIVWAIPVKTQQTVEEKKSTPKNNIAIPSIDKIWDSTPVAQKKETKEIIINEIPIPLTAIPDYAKPKFSEQKKTTKPKEQSKIQKVESPKTTSKPSQTSKPASNLKQNTTSNTSTAHKNNTNPKTTNAQVTKPIQNNTNSQQTNNQINKSSVVTDKPKYNPNSPTMLKYKAGLRAAMFSKFAVGSISGSGTCSVHFSVDSTGKLVNRGFTKQSDNKSLNDAVYYMMMSVPKYNPPPSEYNGETISMTFKINNGEYEISIY